MGGKIWGEEKGGTSGEGGGCTAVGSSSLFFEIQPSGLPPPIEEEEEEATQYSATDFQKTGGDLSFLFEIEREFRFLGKGGMPPCRTRNVQKTFSRFLIYFPLAAG